MRLLTKDNIIHFNDLTVQKHGGNFVPPCNFLNESSIDFMLEAVNAELFGMEMYPTIADRAAFYMFSVVTGHVFQDGNKRTGLGAARLFLRMNGYKMRVDLGQIEATDGKIIPELGDDYKSILFNFTLEIASGKITLDEARQWFAQNTQSQ
ncbi:MAG: type II toxin-antitoxin system death-on-curing family toxin [Saprospiraceae bacterium]|nr:type II toxin-antitoxin system death-on-curing family toxin [Saprospiraceae bacterium]MCF8251925.1 type II toxin-antitoxin system death-on-curing family toxin [Saprospiraceae bacterium]MCF8281625.1 type II toxin-antitoxin system death-on-curing family toxin [Bacteroidales bacterium]MCF8313619.1 type II toxin-antitoxin system death-on-curing family toxin [Saprospiraceae bacterium]MCF8442309.1 type II toxin-antitoxin system death-on-curing family toxin [Saprospiraceae bacterium]